MSRTDTSATAMQTVSPEIFQSVIQHADETRTCLREDYDQIEYYRGGSLIAVEYPKPDGFAVVGTIRANFDGSLFLWTRTDAMGLPRLPA